MGSRAEAAGEECHVAGARIHAARPANARLFAGAKEASVVGINFPGAGLGMRVAAASACAQPTGFLL